eukprot:TRINITY_DN8948_c0_g1_i1.p1 TRINITY_DN8948_c0_g1~~TRINITY_DN8948_c0_g1_i1.p1  ORF type:complete len:388 (+),score=69.71 TRINITY_DN8948_c0_g1_i1:60-1223(+)
MPLQVSSWQEKVESYRKECERWQAEAAAATAELNLHKARDSVAIAGPLQKEMKALREEVSKREATIEETIKERLSTYEQEKDQLTKQLADSNTHKATIEKLQQELSETKTQLARKTAEVSDYLTKSAKTDRELTTLRKQMEEQVAANTRSLQQQLTEKTNELTATKKLVDEETKKGLALKRKCSELEERAGTAAATKKDSNPSDSDSKMLRPCTYLTNETGWRKGQVVGVNPNNKSYSIKDSEKGWVLQDWPSEHVKIEELPNIEVVPDNQEIQPTKRQVTASIVPKVRATPTTYSVGEEAEGNFNGQWFPCVIIEVHATDCSVRWVEDSSFTPNLPFVNIRKVNTSIPKHIPQQPHSRPPGRGVGGSAVGTMRKPGPPGNARGRRL